MRHLKQECKLSRTSSHRKALFRNMVTSLFQHERIKTTLPKAKEVRRIAERLITISKRVTLQDIQSVHNDEEKKILQQKRLHNIRLANKWVRNRTVLKKLFDTYAGWYKDRPGGYTRIFRLDYRPTDNASEALIELVIPQNELELREKAKKLKAEEDKKKIKKKK